MPNIASARKRHRQNLKARARNRAVKSELKTEIRKVNETAAAGKMADAELEFRVAVAKLDRAAAKRIIHPNRAARLKSRLSAHLKSMKKK
ncbi:MAG TPA: 30S ribosomal protein S20 [Pirellulales bacterium]|nr:30S ribosomal protein S20 [Pirellulales bacterium]